MTDTWDLWFPGAGASGLSFCRAKISAEAGGKVLVHAAPPELDVTVSGQDGTVLARGSGLARSAPGPITYLERQGSEVTLTDGWPDDSDLGRIVLLPGGEAGVLTAWWHADDRSEWRWSIELYNHR